ncbi:MAG: hypothetical protein M3032_04030 [Verrucomicrobiota bacterium]|nr:hypothetical protein [Verrucomicrobiota bacterium]
MSDPRNVAHDKKVKQEKAHEPAKAQDAEPKPRRKDSDEGVADENGTAPAAQEPGELEKSVAVLSKLKEMEHYSRANIETLAGLMLTIDDELKQKEFAEGIGDIYAAQDGFQTKLGAFNERYEAKCESLKPAV